MKKLSRLKLGDLLPSILLPGVLLISACSNQSLYDAMQDNLEQECRRMPAGAQEDCLAELDSDYEEYQRQRDEILAD